MAALWTVSGSFWLAALIVSDSTKLTFNMN